MDCRYERRAGERVVLDALPVLWRIPPPNRRRHGRRVRKPCTHSGALLDLSANGLKVRAPTAADVQVGSPVDLEINGIAGTVVIRWIRPVPGMPFSDYGVEIAASATALRGWCATTVSLNEDQDELRWLVGPWRALHPT